MAGITDIATLLRSLVQGVNNLAGVVSKATPFPPTSSEADAYVRINSAGSGFEPRAPSQVLSDIGAQPAGSYQPAGNYAPASGSPNYDPAGAAATAQSNAETYAAGQASAAQSNAEAYAAALPGTSNNTFFANNGSDTGEGDIGAFCGGYDSAYLYNNSSAWGLYSGQGGSIISYNRASSIINLSLTTYAPNFVLSSDRKFKTQIFPIANALAAVRKLNPKTYLKQGRAESGFIAQDVQRVPQLAYLVHEGESGLHLDVIGLIAWLAAAVQELDERA